MNPGPLPFDHPPVPRRRIGVLIANLGTPDATGYWPMRRYLSQFLSDQRVIDAPAWKWQPILQGIILSIRPSRSGAKYRSIWNNVRNESPLLTITRSQSEKIAGEIAARHGDQIIVDFCMRYGNPATDSAIRRLQAAGCDRILFFPLYPHYAAPTTASANDQAFRALMQLRWQPAFRTVPAYFDDPAYIEILAASIERAIAGLPEKPDALVVSYHGVPERYLLAGDPYHCQCQKTTRLLREKLGWTDIPIVSAFQSKFGREKWIGPATIELVQELAAKGTTRIAVVAPAFSADCVETLEEIDMEIRHAFIAAGGQSFAYIPCLNDSAAHVVYLTDVIARELSGWIDRP